jgi:hypothetical protein
MGLAEADNRQDLGPPCHAEMVRGGGSPESSMASMPDVRMGPPPRSLAVDAHECIMVRIPRGSTEYKVVAPKRATTWQARLRSSRLPDATLTGEPTTRGAMATPIVARHALSPSTPRASGATLRALGVDRSARPSKARCHPMNANLRSACISKHEDIGERKKCVCGKIRPQGALKLWTGKNNLHAPSRLIKSGSPEDAIVTDLIYVPLVTNLRGAC